jgi:hypothetical protein
LNLKKGDVVDVTTTASSVVLTPRDAENAMTTEQEATPFAKPGPEEIARRQALFAQVLARRQKRDIRPLTSVDLVHLGRAEEGSTDDLGA